MAARKRRRRLQVPAQGSALGNGVNFRELTLKEFANNLRGAPEMARQPLQGWDETLPALPRVAR
jgi:hypothetical protein